MTGSKMTSMTTNEMRVARGRGEDKSDFELIRHNAVAQIEPADDEDSPDASNLMREALIKRRAGRPAGNENKEQVSVRYSKSVLNAFRASGSGWQTRMDAALADWLKAHSPDELPV
jgi:uncharacterized protein (DUF4415 family)